MPSSALQKFSDRALEVKRLLAICTPEDADYKIKKENAPRDEALLRGAHVLLCSHLEGFFEDLISDLVDAYDSLAEKVAMLPEELRAHQVLGQPAKWESKEPAKRWLTVKEWAAHPLVNVAATKPPKCLEASLHVTGFSNPGTGEIGDLFKTVGISDVWNDFRGIEPDQIFVKSVDAIVNRRNQIAHGKADATITLTDAHSYLRRAERVVEVFDLIVSASANQRLHTSDCWLAVETKASSAA